MYLPPLDSLRCLEAAAQLGSFRAAARSVALTPAALGQRIRLLEDQLGVPLFVRTTRSLRLTPAGMALLPHARSTLAAAELCVRAARGDSAPPPFDLVLGTRHELGISYLLPIREEISASQAGMDLHFYFGSGEDLLQRIRSREVDCAVTSSRLDDPTLEGIELHREPYTFVGSAKLLRKVPLNKPEEAVGHCLLDIAADRPLFRYWRDGQGAPPLRFLKMKRLGTIEAIRTLALQGEGVAVLPSYLVEPDLRAHRLLPVLPKWKAIADQFRLVSRADDPRRETFQAIAATLRSNPLR